MSEEFNAEEQKLILESKRWKNRRKIAYIAMFTGSIICLATTGIMSFGSVERVKALSEFGFVFLGMLGFLGGIIMAYIGTAAYSDVRIWK